MVETVAYERYKQSQSKIKRHFFFLIKKARYN